MVMLPGRSVIGSNFMAVDPLDTAGHAICVPR